MWMIICFLRSQCKNRVTNMSDSKSNLHQSMEKEEDLVISQDNHNQVLEDRLRDTAGNSIVGLLHELNLNREDKNPRSFSEQSLQPFQCRNHKIENKFNGFVNSELRADKSKVEGISKCLKSPILLPCPNTISRGSHLKTEDPIWLMTTDDHPDVKVPSIENSDTKELNCESTCPTTTKVHSGTTILSKDPAHLEAQALNYDMTGVWSINTETLLPTNKCYSPEVKLNTNAEVEQKPSRKSPEYLNQETDQVRYFETHIELMETMINEAHILNGAIKDHISSQENDSQPTKLEIAKTLGKKSKTWSSIYDLENHSVNFHLTAELDPKRPIDVSKGSTIKTEGSDESYFSKELQEELSTITGEVNNTQKKYMSSGDRSQWKYSNHFSDHLDIADEQPGSSIVREKQKVNKKLHQSLHHPQMLGERLWKYHRNCCDEYQPCQTACKVLKQIKALEKTELVQKTKQSPPSDEELFKEKLSLPLLPSTLLEDHTLANPVFFPKMTCTSLPNLSQYGNHQICASQDVISSKSPIQASFNMDLDLPGICDAHGERLKTMPPSNINLPVLKDQTETLVRSENELSKVSYNDLALPINNAQIADDEARKTQDKSGSNLAPEIINIQTDTIRFNNFNNFSASQVELPTISEPLLGVAVQKTSLGNIKTNNSYLSVVGFHKIDVVKSLPSIKILDEDNARDRQQSGKPEISKTKITITEPGRKLFLENQGFELKTQKSQIQTKPDADGLHISADEVNQLAAMSSSLSNSLVGVIPNHGEVTSRENKSLHPQECPNPFKVSSTSLDTQTLLTTSVSYSNSFQDGEEVSDWPKVAYLIKHSSTISLSSNFDILNHQLVTHSNPKHDHLYDVSNKSNTELSNDKMTYKREVIMNKQSCDIADHKNMVVEGLSFNCAFLQQNNMKTEEIKSLIGMENETFYTEDGSQHCGNLIDEEATLRIHNTQGTVRDQVDMNLHFFKYAEQAHIQMENSERMKVTSHNLDSHINNGGTVIYKSNEDNKQTSNVDLVVNSRADIQTRSEEPCRSQTGEVENIKEQTVIHKGDHLKSHFNNRHLKEYKRQEYLSKDFTCPPDAKIQTSKDEDPLSQTKILNNKTCSDLTTSDITDERIDFSINSKLSIEDGNHVAENVKDVSNIFQDILGADSISASEEICALAGSKRKSILGPEILPNDLKINYESDDSRESNYNLKENYCNYDESVDDLRKAPVDVPNCIPVCNSDVTFNTGQANSVDSMDILLCNTETTLKTNQQPLDQHKNPKTHSKQMWSNQKCKTNSSLKTATASDKFYLKDYLSNRIYRRPFNSVFTFSTKTSTEEGEGIGKATLEGEPSANNSVTAKPLLLLSDGYTETKKLEAVEYLTYLYSRSPKPKANVSDIDDISVLANLNFCKVALPEEFAKQKMSADVEEYEHPNVEPADPGRVYVPPSKEELKADDELAVLHVMYNLKKSLELSHNKDTETD